MCYRITVLLDVDIENIDVDWRSEEIASSDDGSESSDDELLTDDSSESSDDELDDNEYLKEVSTCA